jgi:hypothetical protein
LHFFSLDAVMVAALAVPLGGAIWVGLVAKRTEASTLSEPTTEVVPS